MTGGRYGGGMSAALWIAVAIALIAGVSGVLYAARSEHRDKE